jgi:hypothetical protein
MDGAFPHIWPTSKGEDQGSEGNPVTRETACWASKMLGARNTTTGIAETTHYSSVWTAVAIEATAQKDKPQRACLNAHGEAAVYSLGPDSSTMGLKQLERKNDL